MNTRGFPSDAALCVAGSLPVNHSPTHKTPMTKSRKQRWGVILSCSSLELLERMLGWVQSSGQAKKQNRLVDQTYYVASLSPTGHEDFNRRSLSHHVLEPSSVDNARTGVRKSSAIKDLAHHTSLG